MEKKKLKYWSIVRTARFIRLQRRIKFIFEFLVQYLKFEEKTKRSDVLLFIRQFIITLVWNVSMRVYGGAVAIALAIIKFREQQQNN